MDNILLIDAHNALWRASVKYGRPIEHELCNVKTHNDKHGDFIHCACGSPWNEEEGWCYGDKYHLVFSFFRNLRPIIEKFSPDKCFFVLEGHPKYRYELYPEYKANRFVKTGNIEQDNKKTIKLEKFHEQKRIVIDLINYLPITSCRANDYEADDVIGELCENMKDENLTVLSNDTDYIQLLQRGYDNISIYNPIKKEFMVAPEYHYVGWKSLNGDKSDNIEKLLKPKKALETIKDPELLKKFLSNQENNFLFQRNRNLIEFQHVPLDNMEIIEGETNFDELKKRFEQMMFKSLLVEKTWKNFTNTFDCLKY